MDSPTTGSVLENASLLPVVSALTPHKMDMSKIASIFKGTLVPISETEAINYLRPRMTHFGISELFDSSHAVLSHIEEKWTLQNPVGDLFFDAQNNIRLTGTCHQIQPAAYILLATLNHLGTELQPFREWVSFQPNRSPDYYHYYIGRYLTHPSGLPSLPQHELDPSVFYTRLFERSGGATEHQFRDGLAGQSGMGYALNADNPLSGTVVPYAEYADEDGVRLLSIGLADVNDITQARITLNVLGPQNRYAPDRTVEVAFDLNHPDRIIKSVMEKFIKFDGYEKGCQFSTEKNVTLDALNSRDKELIEKTRDRFIAQIKKLHQFSR